MHNYDRFTRVKALVLQNGGWISILSRFGLYDSLRYGARSQPCPRTGEGRTKFRWFQDVDQRGAGYHNDIGALPDGIEFLSWYLGVSKSEAMDEIELMCGGSAWDVSRTAARQVKNVQQQRAKARYTEAEVKKHAKTLQRVKSEAVHIKGTHAESYLRARGITADLSLIDDLGFHSSLSYWDEEAERFVKYPGMLALIRDVNGKPITMHRTFLDPKLPAKANVANPKLQFKGIDDVRGCAVRLDAPIEMPNGKFMIGVSEGIETALAIREASGCPMWAGISDRLMEAVKFPENIGLVIIWADIEPSGAGMAAATRMRDKLVAEKIVVRIMTPPGQSEKADWLDIYQDQGLGGFPILPTNYRMSGVGEVSA